MRMVKHAVHMFDNEPTPSTYLIFSKDRVRIACSRARRFASGDLACNEAGMPPIAAIPPMPVAAGLGNTTLCPITGPCLTRMEVR